jgi:hypothetical protein
MAPSMPDSLKMPYETDEAKGTRVLHLFLRFKSVVATNADLKLYVNPTFLAFLRTRLHVTKCTTLSGKLVPNLVRIDNVDINVDVNSTKPFYIFY